MSSAQNALTLIFSVVSAFFFALSGSISIVEVSPKNEYRKQIFKHKDNSDVFYLLAKNTVVTAMIAITTASTSIFFSSLNNFLWSITTYFTLFSFGCPAYFGLIALLILD